jgi:hypothetical protein
MELRATKGVASRFAEFIGYLSEAVGHADRHGPLASYCTGLLLLGERKGIEPMAAHCARRGWRQTSIAASFRGQGTLGRGPATHRRANLRAAEAAGPSAHPGLDRGRHRHPEEGQAFVRLGMPVNPGNLILLGRIGTIDTIGAPSCAASPKLNGFDWVLQRRLAGLKVGMAEKHGTSLAPARVFDRADVVA